MSEKYTSAQGNFMIEIADDKYSAYLTIFAHKDFLNEKELLDLIDQTKIVYGLEQAQELIDTKGITKQYDQSFPLALGSKPKDAEVEFSLLFNPDNCYQPLWENDFTQLSHLTKIKKGDPLAHLFISKHSKPGKNIFGYEVDAGSFEKEIIAQYLGDNVFYSEERGQIIANQSGYPYLDESSAVHIKSEFVIDKNLDQSIPEINFFGSLRVIGDITNNIRLKMEGDLTVQGDINEADIEVKGNIIVEGDIKNCKNIGIFATGKILLNTAENAKITSGNRIELKKNATFSRLVAECGIYGHEENSSLVGGVYISGEHVEVAIIGNTGSISTEVEISISPYTKECMQNTHRQLMELKELQQTSTPEYQNLQDQLGDLELQLDAEVNQMLKNQDNLPKHIIAYKKTFPGSYIRILKKSLHVTEEMSKVSFQIIDGELVNENY